MVRVTSLYETCQEFFASYPMAVDRGYGAGIQTMLLMVIVNKSPQFFLLSHCGYDDDPFFSLRSWRAGSIAHITPDARGARDGPAASVLSHAMPIPRDGSLFGWRAHDEITALISVDAEFVPLPAGPSWSVLPLASIPEGQWPPFTGEAFLGPWFWRYYEAGRLVSLSDLIAAEPGAVFWVDTKKKFGWDTCVVAHDISGDGPYHLRRGRYVYHGVLRTGGPLPSLEALLADESKLDLAPRFQLCRPALGQAGP